MMEQRYVWEPVDEPVGPVELEIEYYAHGDIDTATHYDAGHLGDDWVSLNGDVVTTISWGAHEDYRLCRRVPAPAAGVPVEVREAINIVIGREGEVGTYEEMKRTIFDACNLLENWLDAQPQPGQE